MRGKRYVRARRHLPEAEDQRALYEKHGYSASIRSGDLLFVSGQVGAREDGSPEPDFGRQVQLAYDRSQAVLEAAGCTFDDVVDVTVFCTDPQTHASVSARKAASPPPN